MIERWFRSLKTELIYINDYTSPKKLAARSVTISGSIIQSNRIRVLVI